MEVMHLGRVYSHEAESLDTHPTLGGRIFMFVVPFSLVLIVIFILRRRIKYIFDQHPTYPFPPEIFTQISWVVAILAMLLIGIYQTIADAWTTRAWLYFFLAGASMFLWLLIFSHGSQFTLTLSFFLLALIAIFSQLLWIEMYNMDGQSGSATWNHVIRNLVGWIEARAIVSASLNLGMILVYSLGMTKRNQAYVFWVITPLVIVGLAIWNVVRDGPLLDQLGYIFAAVLSFAICAISTRENFRREAKVILESK